MVSPMLLGALHTSKILLVDKLSNDKVVAGVVGNYNQDKDMIPIIYNGKTYKPEGLYLFNSILLAQIDFDNPLP